MPSSLRRRLKSDAAAGKVSGSRRPAGASEGARGRYKPRKCSVDVEDAVSSACRAAGWEVPQGLVSAAAYRLKGRERTLFPCLPDRGPT